MRLRLTRVGSPPARQPWRRWGLLAAFGVFASPAFAQDPPAKTPASYLLSMPVEGTARERLRIREAARPPSGSRIPDDVPTPRRDELLVASVASLDRAWAWARSILAVDAPLSARPTRPEVTLRRLGASGPPAPSGVVTMDELERAGILVRPRWLLQATAAVHEDTSTRLPSWTPDAIELDGRQPVFVDQVTRRCEPSAVPEDGDRGRDPALVMWRCVDWAHVLGQRASGPAEAHGMAAGYLPLFLLAPAGEWRCTEGHRGCTLARIVGATARGSVVEVWRLDPQPAFAIIEVPPPLDPAPPSREQLRAEVAAGGVQLVGHGSGGGPVTAVPPEAWTPVLSSSLARGRLGLDVVEHVEHE